MFLSIVLPQIPFLAHGYSNRAGFSSSIFLVVGVSIVAIILSFISAPEGRFYQVLASGYLAMLVASAVTCLVLALPWGGNTKAWNDKSVIIVSNISTLPLPQKFNAKLRPVVRFCGSH
jgi:hypothetical protein